MIINRQTVAGATPVNTVIGKVSDFTEGVWVLHITGTFVSSAVPKVYTPSSGPVAQSQTIADLQNVAYKVQKTGVVTDGSVTAITTPGAYLVPVSAGQVLVLVNTWTSGTMLVDSVSSVAAA